MTLVHQTVRSAGYSHVHSKNNIQTAHGERPYLAAH